MGMIHEAIEWLEKHHDELGRIDTPEYDWQVIADGLGMLSDMSADTIGFIGAWPEAMRNMIIAMVGYASQKRARVRFSWQPAYDFTMTIAKANFGDEPEYLISLGSKYPPEVAR